MTVPGTVLSHAERATTPSNIFPRVTNSMESATISRLISDAFIPSLPIVMPSDMLTVLNSSGVRPRLEPLPDLRREPSEVKIARTNLNPRIGNADDWSSRSSGDNPPSPNISIARAAALSGPVGNCITVTFEFT